SERVKLPGLRRHFVRLLVVAPVADVANALLSKQIGRVRGLLEVRPGPTDRTLACRFLNRCDRGLDVIPLRSFRHAGVYDRTPNRALKMNRRPRHIVPRLRGRSAVD